MLFLICATTALINVRAETESIDLKALAKKARPAVMLLVVSDANGKEIATGTGFLVSSDGKLITNHHVIEGAANAVAKSENGGLFPVEGVLADDPKNDLVLLKLTGNNLPFLTLGSSDNIEVGTRIAVIGSPLGLEGTLSEGIVSAVRDLMSDIRKLQITAAISPGSSGSPVMNARGAVIGIASALLRGGQALNLAVPVEYANNLLIKPQPSIKPQPLQHLVGTGEDAIFSDPDWHAIVAASASEDYIEMLKHAKVLMARYPDSPLVYCELGSIYHRLKFHDDEIAAYRQAVKIKPDCFYAWREMGLALSNAGRIDAAIAAYQQAIKIQPDDYFTWGALALDCFHSGQTNDAIAALRQDLKIKPDQAEVWYFLGRVYSKHDQNDEAIAAYTRVVELDPNHGDAWRCLGDKYLGSSQNEKAITAYLQAFKLRPSNADAWTWAHTWGNLGIAYQRIGQTNDAINAYSQATKIKPDEWIYWQMLATIYERIGKTKESTEASRRALELGRALEASRVSPRN